MIEIDLGFMDEPSLRVFLREQVLRRRAFVQGKLAVEPPQPCTLVAVLHRTALRLRGEIVFVRAEDPGAGVGVQLEPLSVEAVAAIESFVLAAPLPEPELPTMQVKALRLPLPDLPEPPPAVAAIVHERAPSDAAEDITAPDATEATEAPEAIERDAPEANESPEAQALHVRMRSLSAVEQRRIALTGNLNERVMLERMYGPNVWDALLSSGRLSPPEVATIARKGTLPRPLVELIASNAGWLASGEVQRALLSNPRSSSVVIGKVLRIMPKHDLQRVPMQTAYPATVRQQAKELLKR